MRDCERLARQLWIWVMDALPVVWWDSFDATWRGIGDAIADKYKKVIVNGVLVRLVEFDSDALDAPLREIGGVAAGTGASGD